MMYVWQHPEWPVLRWNDAALMIALGNVRKAQGRLLGEARQLGVESEADILVEEAFTTSAIEGDKLDRESVRSSVARRLGIDTTGLPPANRHVDGLVEMLLDATRNHDTPLTAARLKGWQAALFPTGYSRLLKITAGEFRKSDRPMQVVSGPLGRETVHYEAPPSEHVADEMKKFLAWWKTSRGTLDGLVRAAVAHFWFVTIHPFEDGNGRVGRAIADMALAQDEKTGCRLYSVSAQINADRRAYYAELENAQKGNGDITGWIVWFLNCLERAMTHSSEQIRATMKKARFWHALATTMLNERQRKAVNRLLDAGPDGFEGGLTNKKYRGMTSTTPETAKRDMAQLVELGILVRNPGGGRSASYSLNWNKVK